MLAITQTAHDHMLSIAGPQLPVTAFGDGAFSVPSFTLNVSYIVRTARTQYNSLMDCSCPDHLYRGRCCKHMAAVYVYLATEAMKPAKAA